jgi:membrane-associated phospholipid phosphatase
MFSKKQWIENVPKWWHKHYLIDWIAPVVMVVIVLAISVFSTPYIRYLPPNDPDVAYPSRPDIVPSYVLGILWIGCFAVVLICRALYKSSHDLHHGILSLLVCVCVANTLTTALKMMAGRYRPDWSNSYSSMNANEGRYSFPSGHASNAFAAMVWLVMYLMGKYRVFHEQRTVGFGPAALISSPILVAMFVAISRTMDYHHNFSDIIGGSLIGVISAMFAYSLYYPSLMHSYCHRPKHLYLQSDIHHDESFPIMNVNTQSSVNDGFVEV